MPATHQIDDANQVIITTWSGQLTDEELIQLLRDYQKNIKSLPRYLPYDEIADFSQAHDIRVTADGIKTMGEIASSTDREDIKTRLAIIVKSNLAFGLARMYQVYRSFSPRANKETRVFKKVNDAFVWLKHRPGS